MIDATTKTTWTVEQAVSYLTSIRPSLFPDYVKSTRPSFCLAYLRYAAPWTKITVAVIALVLIGIPLVFNMAVMDPLLRGLHTAVSIVFVLTVAVSMAMRSADYRLLEYRPKLFKTRKQTKFLMPRLYVTAGVLGGEALISYLEQAVNRLGLYLIDYPTVFDKASTPGGYKRNGSKYLPSNYDEAYRVVIREFLEAWLSKETNTSIDGAAQLFIVRFFPEIAYSYPKLFGKAALDEIQVGLYEFVATLYALDYGHENVTTQIKKYLQKPTVQDVTNDTLALPGSLI